MKPIRMGLKGLRLRPLLCDARDVVLLTEAGEDRYAVVAADEPDDRDGLPAVERRALARLAGAGEPAAHRKRFSLDDQNLDLAELLAAADDDAAVFLTADGRVNFVLLALGGRAGREAVTAAPVARRAPARDEPDDRPRARGRDARARPDRAKDPGLSGNEWVLYPLLFLAIPAAGVLVSSVLYYAWKADRPRRAGQINGLGFAVFGGQVMLGICIALVVSLMSRPSAGQANLGPNPPGNNLPANNLPANNQPVNNQPVNNPPANDAAFDNQAMPGVEARNAPPKADVASGLLAYWSFDEGRGGRPFNSGYTKPGTAAELHNCRWVAGKRGNAVEFNGTNSWCDLINENDLNFAKGDDLTASVWAKVTGQWGSVLTIRNRDDGGPGICLALENGNLVGIIREDGGEALGPALIKGPAINDGQWHHLLLMRSNAEDEVTLYLDGNKLGSKQASTNGAAGTITTNVRALGCERYWVVRNQFPHRQYIQGAIDEMCIYSRRLTAQEIATLAAGGKPPGSR